MIASPPPRFATGLGWFVIGVGLIVPWAWLVYCDRRLRRYAEAAPSGAGPSVTDESR